MNLSTLTPRQWAYVLHLIEHPDEEPLEHPGNPRKQNLDRIAGQLSEQLDGEELQALRDLVAGKRPRDVEYDEDSGRDLDAEPEEPLDDLEADSAPAFQPAPRAETGAKSRTQAADAVPASRAADGARGAEGALEPDSTPSTGGPDLGSVQGGSTEQSDGPTQHPPLSHAHEVLASVSSASAPEPPPPPAPALLQPRLF